MDEKLSGWGIVLTSVISNDSNIGKYNNFLGAGLNIMQGAILKNLISIVKGALIHCHVSIYHNVEIGDYCEISPGARLLGNFKVGNNVSIGNNATILPKINVSTNSIIGAGSLVTKDVPDNCLAFGTPTKIINIIK
jgi:acetyltransferase-like isoleucine patch superfamily enzyme